MKTSLILEFAVLSFPLGLLVGFGTVSAVRGLFTFLIFMGLALAEWLGMVGVHEIISYFLGQLIIMGSTYLFLRSIYPEALVKVKQELQFNSGRCH